MVRIEHKFFHQINRSYLYELSLSQVNLCFIKKNIKKNLNKLKGNKRIL